jgi:hypothetical protein
MTTEEHERATERLIVAVAEFISDWHKGDFDLPTLAALDAESVSKALANLVEVRAATAPQGDAGEVAETLVNTWVAAGDPFFAGMLYSSEKQPLIDAIAVALTQREQAARAAETERCATRVSFLEGVCSALEDKIATLESTLSAQATPVPVGGTPAAAWQPTEEMYAAVASMVAKHWHGNGVGGYTSRHLTMAKEYVGAMIAAKP